LVAKHQQAIERPKKLREVSKAHKRSVALTLSDYQRVYAQRDEAIAKAYLSGAYTMAKIGQHFKVHYMTVSRAVKKHEER
jgi:putative transposase